MNTPSFLSFRWLTHIYMGFFKYMYPLSTHFHATIKTFHWTSDYTDFALYWPHLLIIKLTMFYKFITNRYKLYLFMLCYSFNIPKDMIRTCSLQTALKQSVHTFSCALDGIFASNVNAIEYWKVKNETSKYISHVTSFLPVFLSEEWPFYRMWEIYRKNKRLSVASCEGKGKSGHYIDKIIWMKKDISYVFPDGVLISL